MSEDVKTALDTLQIERNRIHAIADLDPVKSDQKLVVFMTPSIDHAVTLGYLKSYVETTALLSHHGWATAFQSFGGDPYLAKVRNLLVSTCLKRFPSASDLFFLDADLEWDAEAVLRSIEHPAPIMAGIYPKKNDKPDFPCDLMGDKETGKLLETEDGLVRASMVPTGFLRVKREVYAKMAAQSARYRDGTGGNEECWNIFEMGLFLGKQPDGMDGQWWGEDYAWCQKVQAMGYEILVDPKATFGHRGGKTWRYQFDHAVEKYKTGEVEIIDRTAPGAETRVAALADETPAGGTIPSAPAVEPGPPDSGVLPLPAAPLAQAAD